MRGSAEKVAAVYAKYRNQIKCRTVYLVFGSHDPKHFSSGREAIKHLFTGTFDNLSLQMGNHHYFLSHNACAIWEKRHYGSYHLYGHSHGRAEQWLDSIMPGRFSMDVGVDHASQLLGEYRPFSLAEIENIMLTRSGFGLLSKRR
jgi:hypothetical protein